MSLHKDITHQEQLIARLENSLAAQKLKKRKADTRRKIELGGLIIKSGMSDYSKDVILGALHHALKQIEQENDQIKVFENIGQQLFLEKEV